MRKLLVLAALGMVGAAPADEPLPVVFGIQLGEPLALPECVRMNLQYPHPDGSPAPYTAEQAVTCQQVPTSATPELGAIVFTPDKMPAILSDNVVFTANVQGRIEGLYASTLSYGNADAVLAQITQKFGPPTSTSDEKVVLDAIPITGKLFVWSKANYSVEYHTVSRIEYGSLSVESVIAKRRRVARDAKRDAMRTPL